MLHLLKRVQGAEWDDFFDVLQQEQQQSQQQLPSEQRQSSSPSASASNDMSIHALRTLSRSLFNASHNSTATMSNQPFIDKTLEYAKLVYFLCRDHCPYDVFVALELQSLLPPVLIDGTTRQLKSLEDEAVAALYNAAAASYNSALQDMTACAHVVARSPSARFASSAVSPGSSTAAAAVASASAEEASAQATGEMPLLSQTLKAGYRKFGAAATLLQHCSTVFGASPHASVIEDNSMLSQDVRNGVFVSDFAQKCAKYSYAALSCDTQAKLTPAQLARLAFVAVLAFLPTKELDVEYKQLKLVMLAAAYRHAAEAHYLAAKVPDMTLVLGYINEASKLLDDLQRRMERSDSEAAAAEKGKKSAGGKGSSAKGKSLLSSGISALWGQFASNPNNNSSDPNHTEAKSDGAEDADFSSGGGSVGTLVRAICPFFDVLVASVSRLEPKYQYENDNVQFQKPTDKLPDIVPFTEQDSAAAISQPLAAYPFAAATSPDAVNPFLWCVPSKDELRRAVSTATDSAAQEARIYDELKDAASKELSQQLNALRQVTRRQVPENIAAHLYKLWTHEWPKQTYAAQHRNVAKMLTLVEKKIDDHFFTADELVSRRGELEAVFLQRSGKAPRAAAPTTSARPGGQSPVTPTAKCGVILSDKGRELFDKLASLKEEWDTRLKHGLLRAVRNDDIPALLLDKERVELGGNNKNSKTGATAWAALIASASATGQQQDDDLLFADYQQEVVFKVAPTLGKFVETLLKAQHAIVDQQEMLKRVVAQYDIAKSEKNKSRKAKASSSSTGAASAIPSVIAFHEQTAVLLSRTKILITDASQSPSLTSAAQQLQQTAGPPSPPPLQPTSTATIAAGRMSQGSSSPQRAKLREEVTHVQSLDSNITRLISCLNRLQSVVQQLDDVIATAELDKSNFELVMPHFGTAEHDAEGDDNMLPVVFRDDIEEEQEKNKKKGSAATAAAAAKRGREKKPAPKGKKGAKATKTKKGCPKRELQFSEDESEDSSDIDASSQPVVPKINIERCHAIEEEDGDEEPMFADDLQRPTTGGRRVVPQRSARPSTGLLHFPETARGFASNSLLKLLRADAASDASAMSSQAAQSDTDDEPTAKKGRKDAAAAKKKKGGKKK